MLAAAFNANAMLWKTSPAATELELVVLDWLRQMLGLPAGLFGVIQDTASASTLVALAAAREAVPGLEARRRGLVGQARLRMYASDQAHSSIEKAGIVLGHRPGRLPRDPQRRRVSHGSASPRRGDRAGSRGGLHALRGHRDDRHHLDDQHRPRRRGRRRSASAKGSGCTSTPPMAVRRRWRRSCASCSRGPSAPTRSC